MPARKAKSGPAESRTGPSGEPTAERKGGSDPVETQLEAYNARDLDRFVSCYSPDVRVEDGAGAVVMEGADAIRGSYSALFDASPELHCDVLSRIQVGDWVVHEERVTGVGLDARPDEVHAIAVYHLAGDRIDAVRLLS